MAGHFGAIPTAAFHPDGILLATGGKDDQVRFWNPSTGQFLGSIDLRGPAQSLAFSRDGKLLAVGCMGRKDTSHFRLIDVKSRKIIHEANSGMGEVLSLAWSDAADEKYLAVGGQHGIALWKISGSPVRTETVLKLERGRCLATVVNRQSSLLVWAEENRLKAWDVVAKQEVGLNAPEMNQGWHGLAFLPNGDSIIYICDTGVAEIWNVAEDRHIGSVGEHGTFNAPHVALSPDGRWFAALTQPETASVWHLPSGKHIFSLRPESASVWSLAWDASSSQLAVGQYDGGLTVLHLPKIQKKVAEAGLPWQEND
jgi:WD40 repeat protein